MLLATPDWRRLHQRTAAPEPLRGLWRAHGLAVGRVVGALGGRALLGEVDRLEGRGGDGAGGGGRADVLEAERARRAVGVGGLDAEPLDVGVVVCDVYRMAVGHGGGAAAAENT